MAKVGRKTVFTPEVIGKLQEAAALDCTIEEMAFFAGVHRDTLYSKLQDDVEFSDRIKALRNRPVLKARKTIVDSLDKSEGAQWYLERKNKKEFSTRSEITGENGKPVNFIISKEIADKNGINNTSETNS